MKTKNSTRYITLGIVGSLALIFVFSQDWDAQTSFFGIPFLLIGLIFTIPATAHLIVQKITWKKILGIIFLFILLGPVIYWTIPLL